MGNCILPILLFDSVSGNYRVGVIDPHQQELKDDNQSKQELALGTLTLTMILIWMI